jgi:hypothetical protein
MGRPYGWFDLKLTSGAILNCSIPMICRESGYSIRVELKSLGELEVVSSVNFATAIQCKRLQVNRVILC